MSNSIQPYVLAFILGVVLIVIGSIISSVGIGAVGGMVLLATAIMMIYNTTRK